MDVVAGFRKDACNSDMHFVITNLEVDKLNVRRTL